MSFTLAGNTAVSLNIKLKSDYQEPGSPDIRKREVAIPGRAGVYDFGAEYDQRVFQLPLITLNTSTQSDVQDVVRNLADVLTDDNGDPKEVKLSFDKESGKHYKVKLDSSMGIRRYPGNVADIQLNLVSTKPYAFASTSTTTVNVITSGQTFKTTNSGTAPTPIVMTITNSGATTINGFTIQKS